jgi:hypothetical protein
MNGDHPWLDWFKVLIIFGGGLIVVMIAVKLLIIWAQKDDASTEPKSENGIDKKPGPPPAG